MRGCCELGSEPNNASNTACSKALPSCALLQCFHRYRLVRQLGWLELLSVNNWPPSRKLVFRSTKMPIRTHLQIRPLHDHARTVRGSSNARRRRKFIRGMQICCFHESLRILPVLPPRAVGKTSSSSSRTTICESRQQSSLGMCPKFLP